MQGTAEIGAQAKTHRDKYHVCPAQRRFQCSFALGCSFLHTQRLSACCCKQSDDLQTTQLILVLISCRSST